MVTQFSLPLFQHSHVADKNPHQSAALSSHDRHAPLHILYRKTRRLASRCLTPDRQEHTPTLDRCKSMKTAHRCDTAAPVVSATQIHDSSSPAETVPLLHHLTVHNYIHTNQSAAAFSDAMPVTLLDGKQLDGLFGIQGTKGDGMSQKESGLDVFSQRQFFKNADLDYECSVIDRQNCHFLWATPAALHSRQVGKPAGSAAKDTGQLHMAPHEQLTEEPRKKPADSQDDRPNLDQLRAMQDHLVETVSVLGPLVQPQNIHKWWQDALCGVANLEA